MRCRTRTDPRPRLLMSLTKAKPLTQARARALAAGPGVVIVCGRFEGVDQRAIEARDLDEVLDRRLCAGRRREVAAMVLLEAGGAVSFRACLARTRAMPTRVSRAGVLEYPQYTRPQSFEGRENPGLY